MSEREDNVYKAKLAEQAERYDEMVEAMKKVAKLDMELTVEERNLLSVAYKNVIGARRASWRIISSIEQKEESKRYRRQAGDDTTVPRPGREGAEGHLLGYFERAGQAPDPGGVHGRIEGVLLQNEVWRLWDIYKCAGLVWGPSGKAKYSNLECLLTRGDYHRYLAEFATGNDRKDAAEHSLVAYKAASDIAMTELPPTHPIRLGLALNFSVFYYEILNSPDRACRLAKAAFDDAIAELDTLSEESYKDSTLIMQLLRDNLTLWTERYAG
ncbi:hypothetical protein NQ317_009391 [Molorchus minor]|uniref:14-3-3 domain-containing protein n=1 Tax=Molorchus minor TaxID=1323400 RepID=A0ABQ9JR60_9CUCU|nr:hypothetical protein NQ317_009391 [Molorchus minor]